MVDTKTSYAINPGRALGFLVLGGSLYDIYERLRSQRDLYPSVEVSFSSADPIQAPVVIDLPRNGLRLRFDGADQRLRLIEILDFTRSSLTYQGTELIKAQDAANDTAGGVALATGPTFRQVYHKLFGPTHAGEYFPPSKPAADATGTYILSYPGLAFSFQVRHSAWKPTADFVSLLSSSATQPAHALALFVGGSWTEARQDLLERPCPHPRSLALGGRMRDANPPEIELLKIKDGGVIEFARRLAPAFTLVLGETTGVDLVSQLGPPDAIHRKYDRKMSIHKNRTSSRSNHPPFAAGSPGQFDGYSDTDQSSAHTDYSSADGDMADRESSMPSPECFYNYFSHGIDVFVSQPLDHGSSALSTGPSDRHFAGVNSGKLVATKLIIHGNVPGSYEFNRYRRSRWSLEYKERPRAGIQVTSESPFSDVHRALEDMGQQDNMTDEEKRTLRIPMVLNRDWGDSPASSFDFADLRGSSDGESEGNRHDPSMETTQLYGFPRLLFEVLRNDAINCLTVY